MITAMMSVLLVLGSTVGGSPCVHSKVPGECSVCVDENPEVQKQIVRLQSCPGWMARRKAARALRRYDWKSHPEAADALAEAVLHDDCSLVRQEAAESLAKMRPCLPTVHEAVARAAKCDSSLLTRAWAKKALRAIGKSCVAECSICGPGEPLTVPDQGEVRCCSRRPRHIPLPLDSSVEPLPPATLEVPASPSARSPFTPGSRPPLPSPSLPPSPSQSPDPVPSLDPAPTAPPPLESPSLLPPGDSMQP